MYSVRFEDPRNNAIQMPTWHCPHRHATEQEALYCLKYWDDSRSEGQTWRRTVVQISWYDMSATIEQRRAAYAVDGYPAIYSAPVDHAEQDKLLCELRPYRVRPTQPNEQRLSLNSDGYLCTIAEPTYEGATELGANSCIGPFDVIDISLT
jgi:hypothetical protein